MGIFNKDTFLNQRVESEGSTQRLLIPAGVHEATITEVDVKDGEKDGRAWAQMSVRYTFESPEVQEAVKKDRANLTDFFFLDLTEMGTLAEGEGINIPLNKLRKATDLNRPGFFPLELVGRRVNVSVLVRNKKDSLDGEMVNVIAAVSRT